MEVPDRTELKEGAGEASLGGVWSDCERFTENLVLRCEKKEPIPAPQVPTFGLISGGGGGFEPIKLNGLIPLGRAGGGCGDVSGEEKTLVESRVDRMLPASDFVTFTTLLEALPTSGVGASDELALRCIHFPRTLSTALKNPVEPAVIVRETASRAGASCWSSFISCIPSVSRRPISATTDGRSVHGCL